MKHVNTAALTLVLLTSTFDAGAAGNHDHSPRHGGVVVEIKDLDLELVVKAENIQLHIRDHGKPVKVDGASAKVTLLAGSEKVEVTLRPTAGVLDAKGTFRQGADVKAVAVVNLPGKAPITARFTFK